MSDIAKETLKTIEEKNITPEPRWHFLFKEYAFRFLFVVSTILGGFAVTTMIFILNGYDWDIYKYLNKSQFEYILAAIPYLWIATFILFVVLAYYNFKNTRSGYKHEVLKLVLASVLISMAMGTIFFAAGLDSEIHETFSEQVPFYEALIYDKDDIWNNAEQGLLSGEVMEVKNRQEFILKDFGGHLWQIDEKGLGTTTSSVQKGSEIKLIGDLDGGNIFFVKEIRPWHCCGEK